VQMRNGCLLSVASLMRCIAFRCEVGFGSTDFSLCTFPLVHQPKSHRLKPVLLDRAGLAFSLHEMDQVNGFNKILVRNSR